MRHNKRGYTLVEIVAVVAILGILAGLLPTSISSVFSVRAKRCAYEIGAYLDMCRVNSLSRAGDIYIVLNVDERGRVLGSYYEGGLTPKSSEILSDRGVTVTYKVGGTSIELSEAALKLAFDRGTGGYKEQDGGGYCTEISVSSGRTYVLTLVPSTGSYTIS